MPSRSHPKPMPRQLPVPSRSTSAARFLSKAGTAPTTRMTCLPRRRAVSAGSVPSAWTTRTRTARAARSRPPSRAGSRAASTSATPSSLRRTTSPAVSAPASTSAAAPVPSTTCGLIAIAANPPTLGDSHCVQLILPPITAGQTSLGDSHCVQLLGTYIIRCHPSRNDCHPALVNPPSLGDAGRRDGAACSSVRERSLLSRRAGFSSRFPDERRLLERRAAFFSAQNRRLPFVSCRPSRRGGPGKLQESCSQ